MEGIRSRKEVCGFTIDGPFSRDLDDAIYLKKIQDGWLVQVSIADVAFGVDIGSDIDSEAYSKAFTRYLADHNEPMLPRITQDNFSLWARRERPVITISIFLSDNLEVKHSKIERMRLTSIQKFTYDDVNKIITDKEHGLSDLMGRCYDLALALLAKRRQKGALAFYDVNSGWMTNEEGVLIKIKSKSEHYGHIIVQEFMILANEAVATFCALRDIPIIFRNHSAKKVAPSRDIFIKEIYDALEYPIMFPVEQLREKMNLVMKRAIYEPTVSGHFGLNLKAYTHFTSPLRRYVDLVNHRILISILEEKPSPYSMEELQKISKHCTAIQFQLRKKKDKEHKENCQTETKEGDGKQFLVGNFIDLNDADFHRVLKFALGTELPINLEAEVNHRIDTSVLPLQDICLILCVAGQEWRTIKEKALSYIVSDPSKSVSVFSMACQELEWSQILYGTIQEGPSHLPKFTSVAKISINGKQFASRSCSSSKKKEAEQCAATDLIGVINDIGVEIKLADPLVNEVREANNITTENCKGKLLETCNKNKWPLPIFNVDQKGPGNTPNFLARASIVIEGKEYLSEEFKGANKKQAEQLAAADMIQKIEHLIKKEETKAEIKTVTVLSGNYVGELQEFCQKNNYNLPQFSDPTMTGKIHIPTITVTCTLEIGSNVVSAKVKAKNAKEAKQKAAEQVLAKVQK